MDITPSPSLILSIRNQNLPWHIILGELIDNAFDAAANRVVIAFDRKQLVVQDDGIGCADIGLLVTLGDRQNHKTTELGRYGIGAKDAAISAADAIRIETTHKGVRSSLACDWKHLEKQQHWSIDDAVSCTSDKPSGTMLVLSQLRTDRIRDEESLISRLSLQYSPAIKQGRQIAIQFSAKKPLVVVPEFRFPKLEHQIIADLDVDGKKARITMGVVPEGNVVEHSGIIISFGWRVIKTESRLGLGDRPTPGLFGWLELGEGWELTKNKNNIVSNLDELGRQISEACRATIEVASTRAQDFVFDGVATDINEALDSIVQSNKGTWRKAKRKTHGDKTGTKESTGIGPKHQRAVRSQSGRTFLERTSNDDTLTRIQVAFESMGVNGPACRYHHPCVYLNRDIPELSANLGEPRMIRLHAIYAAATWLATDEGAQRKLFTTEDPSRTFDRVAKLAGDLLSHITQPVVANSESIAMASNTDKALSVTA